VNLGLPDRFVEHATRAEQLAECGLDSVGILRTIRKYLHGQSSIDRSTPSDAAGARPH